MSLRRWLLPGMFVVLILAQFWGVPMVSNSRAGAAPGAAKPSAFLPLVSSQGPPPAVRILANGFLFADRAGNLRFLGEVQNDLGNPIANVAVPVDLLDGGGSILAQGSGTTPLAAVPPGNRSCFDASIADPPPGWASYELEPPTYDPRLGPFSALSVISDTGTLDPIYAIYELTGTVRNDLSVRVEEIQIVGTLYNGAGDVVGCAATKPVSDTLDLGQESAFSILFRERAYFDVKAYRLQSEGQALSLEAEGITP